MFKSKNIKFYSDNEKAEFDELQLTKYCEWPNCQEKGEYKAPTSREQLRKFKFFCLKHVKEYNKAWDYFKGRTSDEIYREVSKDAYWHRKTNKRINKFKIEDKFNIFEENSRFTNTRNDKFKTRNNLFVSSLKVLKLENLDSEIQLKKQYKKMVKKFHPDLNDSGSNEKIIKLNEAYSVLKTFFK